MSFVLADTAKLVTSIVVGLTAGLLLLLLLCFAIKWRKKRQCLGMYDVRLIFIIISQTDRHTF